MTHLQKRLRQAQDLLNQMVEGIIKASRAMILELIFRIAKLETRLGFVDVAHAHSGFDFLPTPDYLEELRNELHNKFFANNKSLLTKHYVQKYQLLFLDVVDALINAFKDCEAPQEEQLVIAKTIKKCPLFNDIKEWKKVDGMNIQDVLILIDQWQENQSIFDSIKEAVISTVNNEYLIVETDLEEAYQVIDAIKFEGSEKQINWAKDIAFKSQIEVARALKVNKKIPTSAKWWIENRNNIEI
jgi:hypothetical protein